VTEIALDASLSSTCAETDIIVESMRYSLLAGVFIITPERANHPGIFLSGRLIVGLALLTACGWPTYVLKTRSKGKHMGFDSYVSCVYCNRL